MSWVLVCDSAKAIIFRNFGDDEIIVLETVEALIEPHPPARELGADRPGRVHGGCSAQRSAVAEVDRHEQEELIFLSRVAQRLDRVMAKASHRGLIVIAPPRVLGVLRRCMPEAAKEHVTGEILKDLAHAPTTAIEACLRDARAGTGQ